MTAAKQSPAMVFMEQPETKVGDLCDEMSTSQTLYWHAPPKGALRPDGLKLLSRI